MIKVLNGVGLLADIVGVALMLFNTAIPTALTYLYQEREWDEIKERETKKKKNRAFGMVLLASGFTLQLLAVILG